MHEWHDIRLTTGDHSSPADGLCLMEAVALFAGERHGDYPSCCDPVLVEWGRVLNDSLPDRLRNALLLPLLPILVGTREPGCTGDGLNPSPLELRRAAALVQWCVNGVVGAEAAGQTEAQQRCAASLGDAVEQLRYGHAQHAARAAANAVAWAVKARWHLALGEAVQAGKSPRQCATAASVPTAAIWEGAVAAFREAAMLGVMVATTPSELELAVEA